MLSSTEENYLKALLRITVENGENDGKVGTNQLAQKLDVRPPSTTDMLKKLRDKKLVHYERYGKISLTEKGRELAVAIVRKHRLWETFLFEKLGFRWDEVHDIAEELEHIKSDKLVEKLDRFLGYPQFDPHGDVIPDASGEYPPENRQLLAEAVAGSLYVVIGVKDNHPDFLKYASQIGIAMQAELLLLERFDYDESLLVAIDGRRINISDKIARNIYCKIKS